MEQEEKLSFRQRYKKYIISAAIFLLAVVLLLLSVRVFSWMGSRQDAQLLVLVNQWNSVEASGFKPRLTDIGQGLKADKRCAQMLSQLLQDARDQGYEPYVETAYRSYEEQKQLYDGCVEQYIAQGQDEEHARALAAMEVGRPGYSEHELGLALDIKAEGSGSQQDSFYSWMEENSWRYGFIQRYPQGKEELTGVDYRPWHYRYVGLSVAEQIYMMDVSLEGYTQIFYSQEADILYDN